MKYIGKIDVHKVYEAEDKIILKCDEYENFDFEFNTLGELLETMHELDLYDLMSRDEALELADECLYNDEKFKAGMILAYLRGECCKYFAGLDSISNFGDEPIAIYTLEDLVYGIGDLADNE